MRDGRADPRTKWLLLGLLGVLALGGIALLLILRRERDLRSDERHVAVADTTDHASSSPAAASRGGAATPRSAAPATPSSRPERSLPAEAARRRELDTIVHQGSKPSAPPQVWPTTGVDGGVRKLDSTAIRAGVKAVVPKLRRCYDDWLRTASANAPQSMRIKADFTIVAKDGEGHIDEGEAIPYAEGAREDVSMQDVTLRSCLLQALTTARFPMPPGDGRVRVKYPFLFRKEPPQPAKP
jgi:hypothetical protein